MLNDETIKKLYNRVDNILSNLSAQDWWIVNKNSPRAKHGQFTSKGKYRHWLPYTLSDETKNCLNILNLISKQMTKEDEELVKGLIMKYRFLKPQYIEDAHYYLKNKNNIDIIS